MKIELKKAIPLSTLELRALLLYVQIHNAHKELYNESVNAKRNDERDV